MSRTDAMYAEGPQVKVNRSNRSGARACSAAVESRPRSPCQRSNGWSPSHMCATRMFGVMDAMASSSRRKMMSAGVRAVDEEDVCVRAEVVQRPGHRHDGCDTAACGQEEILGRFLTGDREGAQWGLDGDASTGKHVVVQPVRDRTADHALHRDGDRVRPGGRRGDV
jgi:hypothetical protein